VMDRPVDLQELSARIRRLLRRTGASALPGSPLGFGPLRMEIDRRHVTWFDQPVALTRKEFSLLELLVHGRGRIFTRAEIAESLYHEDREIVSITSVHGIGYKPGQALFDA